MSRAAFMGAVQDRREKHALVGRAAGAHHGGMRRSPLLFALALAGCFGAHSIEPAPDGGADAAEAGTDAGPDARPVRCAPAPVGGATGEPCFCNGPVAMAGRALYRRSIGIEVYDASAPRAPSLVTTLEERISSNGALVVAGTTLYSVSDVAPSVTVYDVSSPLDPVPVGAIEPDLAGSAVAAAAFGTTLVVSSVAGDGTTGLLHVLDIAVPTAPRLERSVPLGGRAGAVALEGRTAAVVVDAEPSASTILLVDVGTGTTLATARLPGSAFGRSLVLDGEHVLVSGGGRVLTVLRRDGGALSVMATVGEGAFGRALVRDGTLLLAGGDRLRVVDADDPARPLVVGESESPLGDVGAIAWAGELAYVSNGNGVAVVDLRCE